MGGSTVLSGFDVSKWQAGAYSGGGGYTFGFAKSSEGVGYVDSAYYRHIAAIRAHGLVPGAYHYCRYDLGNSPEAEADWMLQVVGDARGMLLAPDIEVPGYNGPLTDWRARFLARLASRLGGYQAPWYSFRNYITTHALNTAQTTWCWLAWPDSNGPMPGLLVPILCQQYGLGGVPGVAGSVDVNRFFGDLTDLRGYTVGGFTPPAPQIPRGEDKLGNFIPYPTTDTSSTQPFGEVYVSQGEAFWGVWGGGAGQAVSYNGSLSNLGSPDGAKDLVDASGIHAWHANVLRLHVRALRPDGSRWLKVMNANVFSVIQDWTLMPSTPVETFAPQGPAGPAGADGAQGPAGPPTDPEEVIDVIINRLQGCP